MDEGQAAYLRERHGYAVWENVDEEKMPPVIAGYDLGRADLPDWEVLRTYPLPVERARSAMTYLLQSPRYEDALVRVDIIEMLDVRGARETLFQLLGEFQSPEIQRRAESSIGDVTFHLPGETAILFARSNVVVAVRNAGPTVIELNAVAEVIDKSLRGRDQS